MGPPCLITDQGRDESRPLHRQMIPKKRPLSLLLSPFTQSTFRVEQDWDSIPLMRTMLFLFLLLLAAPALAQDQENQAMETAAKPCGKKAEHRQFDFWIGEWDVLFQNQRVAESSIQLIIGDCVIFENYSQADGYTGKSFNFYDTHLRKWRQTWVDANGLASEFAGEFKNGALHYEGESHFPDGKKAMRRMTFFNLGPDRVRQLSEISRDDGKTWNPHYDLLYVRKK